MYVHPLYELTRDRVIEDVLIYAVKGGLPKEPMTMEVAEMERFTNIGVEVKNMKTISNTSKGHFEQSRIQTTPVNLKTIWGRRLGIKKCAVIAYEPPPPPK